MCVEFALGWISLMQNLQIAYIRRSRCASAADGVPPLLTASAAAGCCRAPSPAERRPAAAPRLVGRQRVHALSNRNQVSPRANHGSLSGGGGDVMCVCACLTQQGKLLDVGGYVLNQSAGLIGHPSLVGHDGELWGHATRLHPLARWWDGLLP